MSNRLTFSLASLIFLIALGLVFAPVSVMAHQPGDADTVFALHHDGWGSDATSAGTETTTQLTGSALQIETGHVHHARPTVSSIELVDVKIGASKTARDAATAESTVKDTSVLLVNDVTPADDAAVTKVTTGANGKFRVKITFSDDVYNDSNQTTNFTAPLTGQTLADDLLSNTFITDVAESKDALGVQITALTVDEISRVTGASDAFYATITVPSANLTSVPMDAWIGVSRNAVYSKGKFSQGANTVGRGNAASSQYKFSVVKTLPADPVVPDTTAPTVDISVLSMANGKHAFVDGKVSFKLTFSEPLSKETSLSKLALDQNDFEITGHTTSNPLDPGVNLLSGATLSVPTADGDKESYTLTVTPLNPVVNPQQEVRITLLPQTVTDVAGNRLIGTHKSKFDTIPPTVTVIPPGTIKTGDDGFLVGKGEPMKTLVFDFEFSEKPVGLSTLDVDRSGGQNNVFLGPLQNFIPVVGEPNMYSLNVTALDKNKQTTVLIQKETVTDEAGNALVADGLARYLPNTSPPSVEVMGPTVFRCDYHGNMVTVEFTDNTNLPTGETLTKSEITISAGWEVEPDTTVSNTLSGKTLTSKFKVVRKDVNNKDDRTWLGKTTVDITIHKDAIKDETAQGNAESKDNIFNAGPVLEIRPGQYIVVVRTNAYPATHLKTVNTLVLADPNVKARAPMVQYWDCMPDLSLVFDVKPTAGYLGGGRLGTGGGGLLLVESYEQDMDLTKQSIAKGTVGISEIMWAQDQGTTFGRTSNQEHAQEQWIELHNFSPTDTVKVTLFDLKGTEAYSTVSYTGEIDRVSNFNIGGRWKAGDKGQDGNRDRGIDFISMQRETPTDAAKNYSHPEHDGTNGDRWSKSNYSYLTRRAVLADRGIDLGENNLYDFYGTPARKNGISYDKPVTRTDVKHSPVIFNEIANRTNSNRYYEWIELRNVTGAEVNLREYRISYVTAKDMETELYTFPDADIFIDANSVLLLVDTDPKGKEDHPIAADNLHEAVHNKDHLEDGRAYYEVTDFKDDGIPDDGMFVLVLRKANGDKPADLKKPDHVIDVAGYDDNLTDASKHTSLWPLSYFGTPDARNKLVVETVHHRQHVIDPDKNTHNDDKDEHQALRDAGYTGIGYKRLIPALPAHGGTPGYDNGVAKEYNDGDATVSAAPVTISEVMYHTDSGRLPQWIELYNSSMTEVVKVEDWTLQLENADDVSIRTPRVSVKLAAKLIQPNQTILIVASTTGNNSDHFPDSRVIDIWGNGLKDKDRLEISKTTNRRNFKILSETSFRITLKDKAGKVVDTVGNLGADTAWDLPKQEVDGDRSSLIRRYDNGVVRDGTMYAVGKDHGDSGWVLAASSELYETHEMTYYGNITDIGSPGYRAGGPVPVSLSKFRPERLDDGSIVVRWITESELNNAGFNILRSETRNGEYTKLNTQLIKGQGTTSERTTYAFPDTSAKPNVVYYYQIQDVSLDGKVNTLRVNRLKGHVNAAGKLTTTWGELKALQ